MSDMSNRQWREWMETRKRYLGYRPEMRARLTAAHKGSGYEAICDYRVLSWVNANIETDSEDGRVIVKALDAGTPAHRLPSELNIHGWGLGWPNFHIYI